MILFRLKTKLGYNFFRDVIRYNHMIKIYTIAGIINKASNKFISI
ncbi:MAG: hypothetical protein QG610_915 [Euryarchaeota archaeon]|nr:hypothetical protein [Euryarchaeota archaeon]